MTRIKLIQSKNEEEDREGNLFAYTVVNTLCEFTSVNQALDFIDANIDRLPRNVMFLTGSSSLYVQLNAYMAQAREMLV